MKSYYNALTFDRNIMKCAGSGCCSRINYVGDSEIAGAESYIRIENADRSSKNIFVSDILDDEMTDKAIELSALGARVMLRLSETLDEVGQCDKRHGMTPVCHAHKLGLLDGALVAGGVYLDKDDIQLIIQSGAEIALTPTTALGCGHGIPPLRMLLSLGATVHLGTGDPIYNRTADLEFEAKLISLAVSGALCTRDAISPAEIKNCLSSGFIPKYS